MSLCPWRCFEIGGPFIAENPECPIHGRDSEPLSDEEREFLEQNELARQWESHQSYE